MSSERRSRMARQDRLKRTVCVAVFAAFGFAAVPAADAQELPDPQRLGPYPVGVTTLQLDDHGRTDPDTGGPRQLLTEIYYPAADDARNLPKAKSSDFVLKGVTSDEALTYLPMPETHEIINSYATAFWGRFLKGERGYDAFLSENHYGDKIIFKR